MAWSKYQIGLVAVVVLVIGAIVIFAPAERFDRLVELALSGGFVGALAGGPLLSRKPKDE